MNSWQDAQRVRERQRELLAEAERDRLLRDAGLGRGPDLGSRVRGRVLGWAIAAHHRLHELESAQLRHERV